MITTLVTRVRALSLPLRSGVAIVALTPVTVMFVLVVGLALGAEQLAARASLVILAIAGLALGVIAMRWALVTRPRLAAERARGTAPASEAELDPILVAAVGGARRVRALRSLSSAVMTGSSRIEAGANARSFVARDILALTATRWTKDFAAAHRILSDVAADEEAVAGALGDLVLPPAALLARWMLASPAPEDRIAGVRLAEILSSRVGVDVPALTRLRLAHALTVHGRLAAAGRLLDELDPAHPEVGLLRLDAVSPFRAGGASDGFGAVSEQAWLAGANGMYTRAGLEPIVLRAQGETPFDRLDSVVAEPMAAGGEEPLVTVIMSCYEPTEALITAARSIVNQTWRRWELLIMDDASPSRPESLLAAVAALDPRITIVRADGNRGTYVRRNDALSLARGEFVTAHDSDDWAHPRRLELQARHLLAHPEAIGNISESLRVTGEIRFAQPRASGLRLAEASMMVRRREAIERVGFFDPVRKAADSEYRLRLESAFGQTISTLRLGAPLTLVRSSGDSLSGGDFADMWMHPARVAYRSASGAWLAAHLHHGSTPHLAHPLGDREFAAHPHLTGVRAEVTLDVLVLADTRAGSPAPRDEVVALLETAVRAGRRVGVRRAEDVAWGTARAATDPRIQTMISAGEVVEVLSTDPVRAAEVVIVGARCLLGIGERDAPLDAGSLELRGPDAPDLVEILAAQLDTVAGAGAWARLGRVDG